MFCSFVISNADIILVNHIIVEISILGAALKKHKQHTVLIWVVYFVLIGLSLAIALTRGSEGMEPIYYMNIGIDLFGMIVISVIFLSCSFDPAADTVLMRYYKRLINVTFLGLLTDFLAWIVNGIPEFRNINLVANTLYYMCLPLGCYFFWRYVENMLKVDDRILSKVDLVLKYGMLAAVFMRALNVIFGFYFTVDENGIYARASLYPISMIYMFAVSIITMALIIGGRKKMERRQIVILVLYVVAPTAVGVLTMMKYGLSISYGVVTVVMLLMYCIINIEMSIKAISAEREMKLAASIQQSVLPKHDQAVSDKKQIDLYASMDCAREVGGDFYDYFLVDDDHLCVVMADVSDKGVPAALFMMNAKTTLHSYAMTGASPSEILSRSNEAICRNNTAEMFVTVWLGILELSTGKLTAANAGHEYPIFKNPDGEFELYKDRHGFVIGGMEGVSFKEYEMEFKPGTKMFLYTDGLAEAVDEENNMFGTDRVTAVLNEHCDSSAQEIIEAMRKSVSDFVKDTAPFDDMTMLCLEYRG